MSSKIKYILYIILVAMIMGLISLIPSQANAASVSESMQILDNISNSHAPYRGTLPLRFGILQQRHDLYCLGHKALFKGWQTYKNTRYIRITGNTATDYTSGGPGVSVSHTDNGILAYIISTDGGYGYAPGEMEDQKNYSQSQIALYKHINTWCATVGGSFGLGGWGHPNNNAWNGTASSILNSAKQYASSIGNTTSNSEVIANDTTNRNNIKVEYYTDNGTSYIKVGPFNWTFTGRLNSVTLTGNNGVQPQIYILGSDGYTPISASGIESGRNFYVSFRADTGITTISRLEGKGRNSETGIISAELWFLENIDTDTQNVMLVNHSTDQPKDFTIVTDNIPLTINFSVVKVDEYDQTIRLPNVGFKFYNRDIGKYLQFNGNNVNYVDNINDATELFTDQNGRISLNNVLVGTYIAYETKNPNYGYIVDGSGREIVPSNGGEYLLLNTPKYVRLSGTVWEDIQSEKMSVRNDLYNLDGNDDADIPVEGIEVRLMDFRTVDLVTTTIDGLGNDQVIQNPTYTDENGNYSFDYVSAEDLRSGNYFIQFVYDGVIYQSVEPHLENEEKGSKAAEQEEYRKEFNNQFTRVEKEWNEYRAAAVDENGEYKGRMVYKVNESESTDLKRALEFDYTMFCEQQASTHWAGYTIDFNKRVTAVNGELNEIKYINLGIYKRAQADLSVRSEIAKVTAEINGYGHVYNYMTGSDALGNQDINDWNLGIRNYNQYKNAYERPIYKADVEYTNSEDRSKELKMSMIYEVSVINESQLYSKVNRIVNYFNNKYTVRAIGTEVNDQGVIGGTVLSSDNYSVEAYNDTYNKLTIDTSVINQIINPSTSSAAAGESKVTQQKIYIQFDLSRQAIADMLNEGEQRDKTLDLVSEIASYTSYSDANGTLYAAFDVDSVPDNATLNNESTYEDDTEKASPIALTLADARQIKGTIFEDTQIQNDQNTLEGNGVFDSNTETKLNGVKVDLIDANTNMPMSYVNDDGETITPVIEVNNGDYIITEFIPGEYQVRFTWGDGTTRIDSSKGYNGGSDEIVVENYKSTVMDYNTYNSENSNRKYYLDTNIMNGRSQAIDNTDTRREIDSSLLNYKHDSDSSITEIESSTLPMSYGIEYDSDELTNVILDGQNVRFLTENMNFGIIRRAEQKMQLDKTVSNFKFTLPTGQVLIDATVDDDGNLSGSTNYLSYIGDRAEPNKSILRAEIDENLIQGSQLQITYTLKATNVGQADFLSEDYGYYRFGESYYVAVGQDRKNEDIITSSPALIVDYLDESLQYDQTSQINIDNEWQLVTLSTGEGSEESNREQLDIGVLENVLTHKYTDADGNEIDLGNYTIYKTPHLATSNLKPKYSGNGAGESATVQMVVGQNLSSSIGSSTQNQAEIILVTKPGGGKLTNTPGNYIPNKEKQEIDDSTSEQVVVIPSTGGNMNYILPITIGVVACIILGVGTYLIKTKVLKKKDE